jgi:hypothetical protein
MICSPPTREAENSRRVNTTVAKWSRQTSVTVPQNVCHLADSFESSRVMKHDTIEVIPFTLGVTIVRCPIRLGRNCLDAPFGAEFKESLAGYWLTHLVAPLGFMEPNAELTLGDSKVRIENAIHYVLTIRMMVENEPPCRGHLLYHRARPVPRSRMSRSRTAMMQSQKLG